MDFLNGSFHGDERTKLHDLARDGEVEAIKKLLEEAKNDTLHTFEGIIEACTFASLQTPLHEACMAGQVEAVRVLLEAGADLMATTKECSTALHLAAAGCHTNIVQFLLDPENSYRDQCGMMLEVRDKFERTVLHTAAFAGADQVIELILEAGAILEAPTEEKGTSLHLAASNHPAAVRILLEYGAHVDAADSFGHTPLFMAARSGNIGCATELAERNANLTAVDNRLAVPLHEAAFGGHVTMVKQLLDWGAKVDIAMTESRQTALHRAAFDGNVEMVEALLEGGADRLKITAEGSTPAHLAASAGKDEVLKVLLKNAGDGSSADVTMLKDTLGRTPLHLAINSSSIPTAEVLIKEFNSDINQPDNSGQSCLHRAAAHDDTQMARFLLGVGAEPAVKDDSGFTPLHTAVRSGSDQVLLLLLEWCMKNGSREDVAPLPEGEAAPYNVYDLPVEMNAKGETPLHLAAFLGRSSITKILLDNSSASRSLHVKDDAGRSPMDLAALAGHLELAATLIEAATKTATLA